ncbi:MAG: hypothetical protein AAF846_20830 [Chloroflexota bacterium]
MLLLVVRRIIILMFSLVMLVFGIRGLAQQFHPYAGIRVFSSSNDGLSNIIIKDVLTHVTYSTTSTSYQPLYNILTQPRDGKTYIYLSSEDMIAEQPLAVFDAPSGFVRLTPVFSEAQQYLYAVIRPNNADSDTIEVHEIDIVNSEIRLIGRYSFEPNLRNIFTFGENYLIIQSDFALMVVNVSTGDSVQDEITGFAQFHYEPNFLTYTKSGVANTDNPMGLMHFRLMLDTFEIVPLIAPTEDVVFEDASYSSPTTPHLLLVDSEEHLWLHNVLTNEYTALPETFQSIGNEYPWSPDGNYLMVRQSQTNADDYLSYHLATGELQRIFTKSEADYGSRYTQPSRILWSPDMQQVLVYPRTQVPPINFQIYDAQTGGLLIEHAIYLPRVALNPYISWYRSE